MANCFNKNTTEYKALMKVYNNNLVVDSIIDRFQKSAKSDLIPSTQEAIDVIDDIKVLHSLDKSKFGTALLANLDRLGIVTTYEGDIYVVHGNAITYKHDPVVLEHNLNRLNKYLLHNNISVDTIKLSPIRSKKTFKVSVNNDMFTDSDLIAERSDKNKTYIWELVRHLTTLFPNVKSYWMTVKEAEDLHKQLPGRKVRFDKVKSFYFGGNVILIKGRVTSDIAIEEVLHPFINSVRSGNRQLFDSLLSEAGKNFPQLKQQIADSYRNGRIIDQVERDLELVTQALSRHFNKEYESTPTRSWTNKIAELLQWFADLVSSYLVSYTGRTLKVNTANIKKMSMTELAKMLNTKNLEFDMKIKKSKKIQYSLSNETQRVVDNAKNQGNDIQKNIIDNLFKIAVESEDVFLDLNTTPVILDRSSHTYVNIESGDIYKSTTSMIGGKFEDSGMYELSRDLGNDFDSILNGVVSGKLYEDVILEGKILTEEQGRQAFNSLSSYVDGLLGSGAVLLPQVVIADEISKVAGTIDLLKIDRDGKLTILDLKSSKHSYLSNFYKKSMFPVNEGSVWYREARSKEEQFKLTTKMKHSLQTGVYARILSNQGYVVNDESQTYHVLVDVENTKEGQEFSGKFTIKGTTLHYLGENQELVNDIVPESINDTQRDELEKESDSRRNIVNLDEFLGEEDLYAESEGMSVDLYMAMSKTLNDFNLGLVSLKEFEKQSKSYLSLDNTRKENIRQIDVQISALNSALRANHVDSAYTDFLSSSIRHVAEFTEYAADPSKFGDKDYITRILNFRRMIENYRGLTQLEYVEGVSKEQAKLILKLGAALDLLQGIRSGTGNNSRTEGVFDIAIDNYVKDVIKNTSRRTDLSEDVLQDIIKGVRSPEGQDIGVIEAATGDMATSSDTILAVMDKLFKSKQQELLDEVALKVEMVNRALGKLERLKGKTKGNIFDWMLNYNSDGTFDGSYVKKIGKKFYDILNSLDKKLKNTNGDYIQYNYIDNLDNASDEQIEYNKEVYKNRKAKSDFMKAELTGPEGYKDGKYHKYTEEFKNERQEYERFVSTTYGGYWTRRAGIEDADFDEYENKYYDFVDYDKVTRENDDFTGQVVRTKDRPLRVVKKNWVEPQEFVEGVGSMLNEKWVKLQKPTTEVERAETEFYNLFVKMYEDDLLQKLPETLHMLGRAPTVAAAMTEELSTKPNVIAHMWTKTMGAMKELPGDVRNVFRTTTKVTKVFVDSQGNIEEDNLPLFYVGTARGERDIKDLEDRVEVLKNKRTNSKSERLSEEYSDEISFLRGEIIRRKSSPLVSEISQDMGNSLKMMIGMTENYHVMSELEDTYKAMIEVLQRKEFNNKDENLVNRTFNLGADLTDTGLSWAKNKSNNLVGRKGTSTTRTEARTVRKAKQWMKMVFYDNDKTTKKFMDKVSAGLIQVSSATYVAFNVFGNLNNYVMGRVNNAIEGLGGRYFGTKEHAEAVALITTHGVEGMFQKIAEMGVSKNNKSPLPNKTLAFIDYLRMLDLKSDMRETTRTEGDESYWQKFMNFGYILQDAGEWNVQSKVGTAIVLSSKAWNSETGESKSLYHAMDYDNITGKMKIQEGFDQIQIYGRTDKVEWNADSRRDLRNYIREVNKQIHGNYAKEDRMAIQQHALGQLGAQFHKWVAPAVKSRFRSEYFDENLGWLEGRYITAFKFMAHTVKTVRSMEDIQNAGANYKDYKGERGRFAMANVQRTAAEVILMMMTYYMKSLLMHMWDCEGKGEECKADSFGKRLQNVALYQTDRLYKEQVLFWPLAPQAYEQVMQMASSPIAATRSVGEIGAAISLSVRMPFYYLWNSEEEMLADKEFYYQKAPNKGKMRLGKEWGDVVPIWYTYNKWESFKKRKSFYIKN